MSDTFSFPSFCLLNEPFVLQKEKEKKVKLIPKCERVEAEFSKGGPGALTRESCQEVLKLSKAIKAAGTGWTKGGRREELGL